MLTSALKRVPQMQRIGVRYASAVHGITQPSSMKIAITGASGMVGRALVKSLSVPSLWNGFLPSVYTLVRRQPKTSQEIFWDPYEMRIDLDQLEGFDVIINLAGENIGSGDGPLAFLGRWNYRKKHHIMESRRRANKLIANAMSALDAPPKVFITASAVGYYGARSGSKLLTEDMPAGEGFTAEVCEALEEEAFKAEDAGVRVVALRQGLVLAGSDGALAKMATPFRLGFGGPIGSGNQYMSYVALDDLVRVIQHAISRDTLSGPLNVCTPNPVTNKDFAKALGRALHRPALMPLPEFVVDKVFGEMGRETLLASQNMSCQKLLDSGFRFKHPDIDSAISAALTL